MYQRPSSFKLLPDVIKNLLIINGLFFLGTIVLGDAFQWDLKAALGLYLPGSPFFRPYQFVTHLFIHADISHIFSNMFTLWMFGMLLENLWGPKRFLIYYMITGFGAAFLHFGVMYLEALSIQSDLIDLGFTHLDLSQFIESGSMNAARVNGAGSLLQEYGFKYYTPTIGASGAVYGILMAAGMTYPNSVMFPFPIKIKHYVLILGGFEIFNSVFHSSSGIAHLAHLGGMLFGFLLLKYWQKNSHQQY